MKLALLALGLIMMAQAQDSSDWSKPLRLYQGSWAVKWKNGGKADLLVNECSTLNKFFACGQTTNGSASGLLIFVATAGKPGAYRTQTIMPDGRASGVTDLEIASNTWTYTTRRNDGGGRTTYYRTINIFQDRDHIHFEMAESNDGKAWTVKNGGDEERVRSGRGSH